MIDIYRRTGDDTLSLKELELYKLIMDYRSEAGLPEIALSKGLTITAGRHAADTVLNEGAYVGHSWSDAPYDGNDATTYPNMWNAPQRLGTDYTGNGYEISTGFTGSGVTEWDMTPELALSGWQGSTPHDNVIMNRDIWVNLEWKAIGVGMRDGVAHVWFGEEVDTDAPRIRGTRADDKAALTRFDDAFVGKGGDDNVRGRNGDDMLKGQRGDDTLKGGRGEDVVNGGKGDDLLAGGGADDRFVFGSGNGDDKVRGFRDGDVLDLRKVAGVDDLSDLTLEAVGSATLISADDITIRLLGVAPGSLDAGDFLF